MALSRDDAQIGDDGCDRYETSIDILGIGTGISPIPLGGYRGLLPSASIVSGGWLAIDIETTGLDLHALQIRTVQLAWIDPETDRAAGVVLAVEDADGVVDDRAMLDLAYDLRDLVAGGCTLWSYGPFDARAILAVTGVTVPIADASRFHHLVEPVRAVGADPFKRELEATFGVRQEITAVDTLTLPTDDPVFLRYALLDATGLRGLLEAWRTVLVSWELDEGWLAAWVDREMRLADIAEAIGEAGVLVDPHRVDDLLDGSKVRGMVGLRSELADVNAELELLAPGLNPRSSAQVIARLEGDGVTVPTVRRRAGTYTKSVGSRVLSRLDHPLAAGIVRSRRLATSIGMIEKLRDAADLTDDDQAPKRVRTRYRSLGAVTSRWSSSKPNLQNVPKGRMRDVMRMPGEGEGELALAVVGEVLVMPRGYAFVQADLSQIEYRVAAALSGDEAMLEAFAAGDDFHVYAARVLSAVDHPTKAQRSAAKGVGFGKLYGQQVRTAAELAGVSLETMRRRVAAYDAAFPRLKAWTAKVSAVADASGWTPPNPYGRRFRVGRGQGYMAVNYLCQSTAREVFCDWLLAIAEQSKRWHIVAAVHDEVLLEVQRGLIDQAGEMLVRTAAACEIPGCDVPIVAESHWSDGSWADIYSEDGGT